MIPMNKLSTNVNEQCDEDVQVDLAEDPYHRRSLARFYLSVRVVQVVSIYHRVQAFSCDGKCFELKINAIKMVRRDVFLLNF